MPYCTKNEARHYLLCQTCREDAGFAGSHSINRQMHIFIEKYGISCNFVLSQLSLELF